MRPQLRLAPLALVVVLAACQPMAPTGTGPSAGPSEGPSALPSSPVPTEMPSVNPGGATNEPTSASTAPAGPVKTETIVGRIYNMGGSQIENAEVLVDGPGETYDRTVSGAGGAYGVKDVPVGTILTLTARAPGFASRSRTMKVAEIIPFQNEEANDIDFGGTGAGMFYALTNEFEIVSTEPRNLSKAASANPLSVTFRFSVPMPTGEQGRFENLIRVRVPGTDEVLRQGFLYRNVRATVTWNADSTEATFVFPAPIVTRATNGAVVVYLDPDEDFSEWPVGANGRRLGWEVLDLAYDGSGSTNFGVVAPFAREAITNPIPSVRPSPMPYWAATHYSAIRFELGSVAPQPLQVKKVEALPGLPGANDHFLLTFNQPMRGFPESGLSSATLNRGNYRFVLGRITNVDEREAFEAATPKSGGASPSDIEFDPNDPTHLLLSLSPGVFGNAQRFKLYIAPAIEDIAGNKLADADGFFIEGAF